jgi:CO/xanthine dehydrogenase Mo-binding subunit
MVGGRNASLSSSLHSRKLTRSHFFITIAHISSMCAVRARCAILRRARDHTASARGCGATEDARHLRGRGSFVADMVLPGQREVAFVCSPVAHGRIMRITKPANGQPLASTLADYLLPGATEVPAMRSFHMHTPSPYTEFGIKGMGDGGAIAPPAAIFNAVNDALAPLGVELAQTPLTPRRLRAALERAEAAS